ncbi:hypothetical protein VP01_9637g1, partial [Puccinia sorghi]
PTAVNKNFPNRYLEVIKPVQAHSDNKYFPRKDVYIVNKLPFRSEAATTFFLRLDLVIKQLELEDGKKKSSPRRCPQVKNTPNTIFPKVPKGMWLDFYDLWKTWIWLLLLPILTTLLNSRIPLRRPVIHDLSINAGMLQQKTSEEEQIDYSERIDLENTD